MKKTMLILLVLGLMLGNIPLALGIPLDQDQKEAIVKITVEKWVEVEWDDTNPLIVSIISSSNGVSTWGAGGKTRANCSYQLSIAPNDSTYVGPIEFARATHTNNTDKILYHVNMCYYDPNISPPNYVCSQGARPNLTINPGLMEYELELYDITGSNWTSDGSFAIPGLYTGILTFTAQVL
jgi:hypothetical protein